MTGWSDRGVPASLMVKVSINQSKTSITNSVKLHKIEIVKSKFGSETIKNPLTEPELYQKISPNLVFCYTLNTTLLPFKGIVTRLEHF